MELPGPRIFNVRRFFFVFFCLRNVRHVRLHLVPVKHYSTEKGNKKHEENPARLLGAVCHLLCWLNFLLFVFFGELSITNSMSFSQKNGAL